MKCHYCNESSDLRPYGPRWLMVCFDCAMSTPERKKEAEQSFGAQLEACGSVAVLDGGNAGPYPLKSSLRVLDV